VLTATPAELLEAAVTGASSRTSQHEALNIPAQPLDVLCQQLLGMAAQRPWLVEEAFALVRRAYPFRDLSVQDFDDCLDYLSGRQRDGRLWLPSRLRWTGQEFHIADARTARLLRRNLGTIITEETRAVCFNAEHEAQKAERTDDLSALRVGEVDEAFADRLQPGDRFLLDGRCLEFRRTEGRALVVDETTGRPATPRWLGNGWPLAPELARRLYLLRIQAAEALRDGPDALAHLLRQDYGLGDAATAALVALFQRQECVSEIPDATTCLVEVVPSPGGIDCYVHTPLNRAANDAIARVAVRRLAHRHGRPALSLVADLGFLLAVEDVELTPLDFLTLLQADDFDADLSAAIEDSASLRERFRCVALTGLMLLRHPLGGRPHVGGRAWAERRLFEQVRAAQPDFVLLRQAWREIQEEVIDSATAKAYLEQLPRRTLRWRSLPGPSPLAEGWTQVVTGPVEITESAEEALKRLHAALMGEGA
jgi:ATP-dependent Lhr-like helicase